MTISALFLNECDLLMNPQYYVT